MNIVDGILEVLEYLHAQIIEWSVLVLVKGLIREWPIARRKGIRKLICYLAIRVWHDVQSPYPCHSEQAVGPFDGQQSVNYSPGIRVLLCVIPVDARHERSIAVAPEASHRIHFVELHDGIYVEASPDIGLERTLLASWLTEGQGCESADKDAEHQSIAHGPDDCFRTALLRQKVIDTLLIHEDGKARCRDPRHPAFTRQPS
mmetsp:Transcript_61362/g.99360  ORF Transcript_61362/g.99360 Transcript_61362/m.99360 type:complete len:202 (+) Transcript_61362:1903-2508(+)